MRARVLAKLFANNVAQSTIPSDFAGGGDRPPSRSRSLNKGKRNAERRVLQGSLRATHADVAICMRFGRGSPIGVPPRLLRQRPNATAQVQRALPGNLLVQEKTRRQSGVTCIFACPSPASFSQAGHRVCRASCRSRARAEVTNPQTAGTALAPPAGVTGRRPFT